jgi:hypothetical protein
MTVKVEIDPSDAEFLAYLKRAHLKRCMSWDNNLAPDVTIKIEIAYGIGGSIPMQAIEAVNKCITECAAAYPRASENGEAEHG